MYRKNYQNRKVAVIENGSWAPMAAKHVKEILKSMKNIEICDKVVTIKTRMTETNKGEMEELVKELLK